LFPFSVFPTTRSLEPRRLPRQPSLAPSGFCTLSTLCSPRDLSDLFHSDPALGICALQGFLPASTPRTLSGSVTLLAFLAAAFATAPCLQGFARRPSCAHHAELFTRIPARPFLGSLSCEASCPAPLPSAPQTALADCALRCDTPLLHFHSCGLRFHADRHDRCFRVSPVRCASSLSRDSTAPLEFSTSSTVSTL
jgi:hypothetical protein